MKRDGALYGNHPLLKSSESFSVIKVINENKYRYKQYRYTKQKREDL
jgi:hypothetical protein